MVALLKAVAPDILIVLGGPEVSYETERAAHLRSWPTT